MQIPDPVQVILTPISRGQGKILVPFCPYWESDSGPSICPPNIFAMHTMMQYEVILWSHICLSSRLWSRQTSKYTTVLSKCPSRLITNVFWKSLRHQLGLFSFCSQLWTEFWPINTGCQLPVGEYQAITALACAHPMCDRKTFNVVAGLLGHMKQKGHVTTIFQ